MRAQPRKNIRNAVKVESLLLLLHADEARAHNFAMKVDQAKLLKSSLVVEALLLAYGMDPTAPIDWDHQPALKFREKIPNDDGTHRYVPDELDPRYLRPLYKADHQRKTSGHAAGEGTATVAGSDQHMAGKVRRLRGESGQGPKRKIQSRGFAPGKRPLRSQGQKWERRT